MTPLEMLVNVWVCVMDAGLVVWLTNRYPPARWVNYAIIGGAGSALLVALMWMVAMLVQYPNARWGLAIALAVVGVLGFAWWAMITGWRPRLPRWPMRRVALPLRMVWPRPRYRRQYYTEQWTVEDVE